jgi:hypothetical protein
MVADDMNGKGVSIRQLAKQFGVRESALLTGCGTAGRCYRRSDRKSTALDSFEGAVHVTLERLWDVRITGEGRLAQVRQVYDVLRRAQGVTGSYKIWWYLMNASLFLVETEARGSAPEWDGFVVLTM